MSTKPKPATPAQPRIYPIPPKTRERLQALTAAQNQHAAAAKAIASEINAIIATISEVQGIPEGYAIDLGNLDAGIFRPPPDTTEAGSAPQPAQETPGAA